MQTEGLRYNKGKVDYTQLSPIALQLMSHVLMYGGFKYARGNFKFMKQPADDQTGEERAMQEFFECVCRHLNAYQRGEWLDPESGQPHFAHAMINLAWLMDVYYLGCNHLKDGKDLYHQPPVRELPPVPTKEAVDKILGRTPKKE